MALRIYVDCRLYLVTDEVGPHLCFIDVVVLLVEVILDDVVDLLAYERLDIIEDRVVCVVVGVHRST